MLACVTDKSPSHTHQINCPSDVMFPTALYSPCLPCSCTPDLTQEDRQEKIKPAQICNEALNQRKSEMIYDAKSVVEVDCCCKIA